MSAMPALDWPEDDPASWPEDDAASRSAATGTVPVQLVRTETASHHPSRNQAARNLAVRGRAAHDHAAHDHAAHDQAVRGHTARSQPVRGHAPRGDAAPAPLRLTRRGRIVVAAAAAILVTLLSLLVTGGAWATSHSAPSGGADRNLAQVVVLPGQSLWSVAQNADPNADPRQVMQQIVELNGLASDVVQAGQQLWVPRG
jgi:hypothetical protein